MPEEVHADVGGRRVALTNLGKVLYPAVGFTKAEVVHYYASVAPVLLPHLTDRVITRLRFPDGVGSPPFYEKNAPLGLPDWVRTCRVHGSDSTIDYLVVDQVATLVLLANQAALELHAPQWRIPAATPIELELDGSIPADRVMIDLDPGAGTTPATTAKAALLLAGELAAHGLLPSAKTTGSKGLHVQAAIRPTPASAVVEYVRTLAAELQARHRDLFVVTQAIAQRTDRVLIDVLQNLPQRNTIAAYSLRGRERPTVAAPVTWDEVAAAAQGGPGLSFTATQVLDRLDLHGDLAADLLLADPPAFPG